MNITISPKQQFLEKQELAQEFRKMVTTEAMLAAVTHTLAEMGMSAKFDSHQMEAVKDFVERFMNIGERVATQKPYPSKTLEYPQPLSARGSQSTHTETV